MAVLCDVDSGCGAFISRSAACLRAPIRRRSAAGLAPYGRPRVARLHIQTVLRISLIAGFFSPARTRRSLDHEVWTPAFTTRSAACSHAGFGSLDQSLIVFRPTGSLTSRVPRRLAPSYRSATSTLDADSHGGHHSDRSPVNRHSHIAVRRLLERQGV